MQSLRAKSCLIACVLVSWMTGCGSSSGGHSTSPIGQPPGSGTSARGGPGRPRRPARETTVQARALAAAINLSASDVPGFSASRHTSSATDQRRSAELARCSRTTAPSQALADVHSDDFKSGSGLQSAQVSSEVEVVRSAKMVPRDLAAVRSPRARDCLARRINALVFHSTGGVHVALSGTRFSRVPASAPGADGSFGYRIQVIATASASGRKVSIPLYVDGLGFAVGTAEVSLTTFGVGQPFPAGTEQQLFSVLVGRAVGNRI